MSYPKSTDDYPRPCRGGALMGTQEYDLRDEWPKAEGYAPRLAGLKGCATGRKDAQGKDVRDAGPNQVEQLALAEEVIAEIIDEERDAVIRLRDSGLES